jgi:hypothetical protein
MKSFGTLPDIFKLKSIDITFGRLPNDADDDDDDGDGDGDGDDGANHLVVTAKSILPLPIYATAASIIPYIGLMHR